jgi:hypothetical protein
MPQHNPGYPLDYTQGPRTVADTAKEKAGEMAGGTIEQLQRVAQNADEIADRAAEQARVYVEEAQELAKNFRPYLGQAMKERPMATLAAASAIAFALGALWKK